MPGSDLALRDRSLRARSAAAALLVALPALVATPAQAKLVRPLPPATPPILVLAEAIGAGNRVSLLAVNVRGGVSPELSDLPSGVGQQLAVDAGSGRWALAFHQLDGGDPLVLGGATHTQPLGPSALVVGRLGEATPQVLPGDPACHSRKVACFETPVRFDAAGEVLITHSESARWWMWNRRVVAAGAKAKAKAIVAKALARSGGTLSVGDDDARAVYATKAGFVVTPWPTQTVRKAPQVKAKKPVARVVAPVIGAPTLIGDHVFYFRRDADQSTGVLAAWNLTAGREVVVARLPLPYPLWSHRFLAATARGKVVFQVDTGFEQADVYEADLASLGTPPRRVGGDVRELLDVSADGRFALAAAYREPDAKTRTDQTQVLVVLDLAAGTVLRTVDTGLPVAKLYDARFAGR